MTEPRLGLKIAPDARSYSIVDRRRDEVLVNVNCDPLTMMDRVILCFELAQVEARAVLTPTDETS